MRWASRRRNAREISICIMAHFDYAVSGMCRLGPPSGRIVGECRGSTELIQDAAQVAQYIIGKDIGASAWPGSADECREATPIIVSVEFGGQSRDLDANRPHER